MSTTPAFHSRSDALRGLRERARQAPNAPGVYRFLGPRGEVLYVGKSVGLRRRLLSYFRPAVGSKERELVRVAACLEWDELPNELEALLREYRLIRTLQPRFNRRHRTHRRYAWIRITPGAGPRLRATRVPVADGSRYFGPFPAPSGLPELLKELERTVGLDAVFPGTSPVFSGQLDLLEPKEPEHGPGEDEARHRVAAVIRFLEARGDEPLAEVRRRIADATASRHFELAARLRDRQERLAGLREDVVAYREILGRLSCVYLPPAADRNAGRGYLLSGGRIALSFPWADGEDASTLPPELRTRIEKLASRPVPPPDALTVTEREETFVVARWFRANPGEWDHTLSVDRFVALGG